MKNVADDLTGFAAW